MELTIIGGLRAIYKTRLGSKATQDSVLRIQASNTACLGEGAPKEQAPVSQYLMILNA